MSKVRLARKVSFSSGHRYWNDLLSEQENKDLFGDWASPSYHGHNYVLWVTVEGSIDPETGMVINIKTIDDHLQETIVSKFDQKSLNDETGLLLIPSLENLIRHIHYLLYRLPCETKLVAIKLEETPTLCAEWAMEDSDMITLTRSYEFAASHRLHSPQLTDAENVELFGKCNNLHGHGHNYILEVSVIGAPDLKSGMLVQLNDLDQIVETEVVDRYDHKNFNHDLPEFEGINPTSEIVALEIFNRLKAKVPAKLSRIRLYETARNMFEVSAT